VSSSSSHLAGEFLCGLSAPFSAGTTLWGTRSTAVSPSWPATTIRGATEHGENGCDLHQQPAGGERAGRPVLARYLTTDYFSVHWADPLGLTAANHCMDEPPIAEACLTPYAGPVPAVVHLHGAEVLFDFDGQPAKRGFTPGLAQKWPAYVRTSTLTRTARKRRRSGFHDHAPAARASTCTPGSPGFYLIRDARDPASPANAPNLPAGDFEQELMISDRQFDIETVSSSSPTDLPRNPIGINGPPPNPDHHPYWNPEFFGDVIAVNGISRGRT